MKVSIYISYRRDDSYAASSIHDRLAGHFGRDAVLRDVMSIEPGADFIDEMRQAVRQSGVCIVIIGDTWLERDQSGMRRIDNPGDFIRFEIETAFAEGKPVIPVLVGNASIPAAEDLPESIRELSYVNAAVIRTGRDFSANISRLIQGIESYILSPKEKASILAEDIPSAPPPQAVPATDGPIPGHSAGSVFISYRRDGGAETARLIRYELLSREWSVFLDVEDLKAGQFDDKLLAEVARSDNFLLILSPGALKNCEHENDWFRKEITHAIETKRNIVPLLKENAQPPSKKELPHEMEPLKRFNCVDYSHMYYDATIARLFSFLKPRTE